MFEIIAAAYVGGRPLAVVEKIQILEAGTDMVLAAHRTPLRRPLIATTVETVRFTRPERIDFRLVRGPGAACGRQFVLDLTDDGTVLEYDGELGTDLWWVGQRWGAIVATRWEEAVAGSLATIAAEVERRAAASLTRRERAH